MDKTIGCLFTVSGNHHISCSRSSAVPELSGGYNPVQVNFMNFPHLEPYVKDLDLDCSL